MDAVTQDRLSGLAFADNGIERSVGFPPPRRRRAFSPPAANVLGARVAVLAPSLTKSAVAAAAQGRPLGRSPPRTDAPAFARLSSSSCRRRH
jgi:hypothetical protein